MSGSEEESCDEVSDRVYLDHLPPKVSDRREKVSVKPTTMEADLKAQIATLKQELDALRQTQTGERPSRSSANENMPRLPDIRELQEYVTVFDPSSPTCASAEMWVKSIDDTGDSYNWSNELRLHCARLNLGGCAKLWLEGYQEATRDWESFKTEIVKGFPTKKNPVYYHNLMSARKWKPNEAVEEYVYEMAAMGRKGGFTEDVIVTYIMSGLKSFLQKSGLAVYRTETVQGLLEQLRWVDNVEAITPSQSRSSGGMQRSTGATWNGGRKARSADGELSCYQCHEAGHVARKCPKVKCFRCSKEGHVKRDCKANLGSQVAEKREPKGASGTSLMRVVDKKSLFRKTVKLAGGNYEAHVDSGADRSTIWEKFKHKVGQISSCHFMLQGFGKSEKVKVTEMVTAKMRVDGLELEVSLAVVPEWAQDIPIIIGKDIIERDDLVMVKRKDKVCFEWDVEDSTDAISSLEEEHKVANIYKIDWSEGRNIDQEMTNSEGSTENTQKLLEVVRDYRDCFALDLKEMGRAKSTEMKIRLEDNEPVFVKPRRMEYAKESALAEITNELLEAGIIQETESPFYSRVVLVPKKNKQFRMAVDYRMLNAKTVKDRFPMPDIDTCFNKLAGAQVFISVDLYSGYYQIPLDEESQNYTAFSTTEGHYRFLHVPFGFANGCAVFQRAVNKMVEHARKRGVVVVAYIDDLVVAGQEELEVLNKFVVLLDVIRGEGFTINLRKSCFFMRKVLYDPSADLELHTDASSGGLAGILLMKTDGGFKPIGFFSRKTSETEAKYHSYDLEMLAIVASVERFRMYLLGRFFVIRTDCSAVRDAYRKREMDHRVARFFLKLQEYDFRLEHRSGSCMKHADATRYKTDRDY
ncbi:uncharacterized protein LOC129772930 [Toxorhynchites rutilus septentrionalis]|uniref:uncharacterized protein LOC129772930 n=1 Tax=Toxorhynchites rutilus septentrionalis TaxID=329112 RepID=UPI00247A2E05|nr:uncharacterized protein LOC129772930 [Toxorhynchites rutilus septentrionalis]